MGNFILGAFALVALGDRVRQKEGFPMEWDRTCRAMRSIRGPASR
jgi:hypothetical protein